MDHNSFVKILLLILANSFIMSGTTSGHQCDPSHLYSGELNMKTGNCSELKTKVNDGYYCEMKCKPGFFGIPVTVKCVDAKWMYLDYGKYKYGDFPCMNSQFSLPSAITPTEPKKEGNTEIVEGCDPSVLYEEFTTGSCDGIDSVSVSTFCTQRCKKGFYSEVKGEIMYECMETGKLEIIKMLYTIVEALNCVAEKNCVTEEIYTTKTTGDCEDITSISNNVLCTVMCRKDYFNPEISNRPLYVRCKTGKWYDDHTQSIFDVSSLKCTQTLALCSMDDIKIYPDIYSNCTASINLQKDQYCQVYLPENCHFQEKGTVVLICEESGRWIDELGVIFNKTSSECDEPIYGCDITKLYKDDLEGNCLGRSQNYIDELEVCSVVGKVPQESTVLYFQCVHSSWVEYAIEISKVDADLPVRTTPNITILEGINIVERIINPVFDVEEFNDVEGCYIDELYRSGITGNCSSLSFVGNRTLCSVDYPMLEGKNQEFVSRCNGCYWVLDRDILLLNQGLDEENLILDIILNANYSFIKPDRNMTDRSENIRILYKGDTEYIEGTDNPSRAHFADVKIGMYLMILAWI